MAYHAWMIPYVPQINEALSNGSVNEPIYMIMGIITNLLGIKSP